MPSTGEKCEASGVYECSSCGKRKTVRKGATMPPCRCGGSRWRAVQTTTSSRKKKKGFLGSLFG